MPNDNLIEENFQYYIKNQNILLKKYNGKVLVIQEEKVVDAFDEYSEAYFFANENLEKGTYIIQLCSPGDSAYKQTFHSRVRF